MTATAGMQVTPHVRLLRPLGEGGMGSVWLAHHATLDTEVAVKLIAEAALKSPAAVERFRREASVAAKIKSPHVVQTFDHGTTDDGTPFIVMESLHGESLAERLARQRLSTSETKLLASQLGEVLGRAHALGVVHRDIKPGNLFLIDSGYELFVKVLDFGIARAPLEDGRSPLTQSGTLLGTPLYMSPEQIEAPKDADHLADLWALAVVLYECLAGRVPFDGENVGSLCINIAKGVYTPPSHVEPSLSPDLDAFFARAFAVEPEARFPDAAHLVAAFGGVLGASQSRPGPAHVVTPRDAPPARASDPTTPFARPDSSSTTAGVEGTVVSPVRRGLPRPVAAAGLLLAGAGLAVLATRVLEAPPGERASATSPSAPVADAPDTRAPSPEAPSPEVSAPSASPSTPPKPTARPSGSAIVRPPPAPPPPPASSAAPSGARRGTIEAVSQRIRQCYHRHTRNRPGAGPSQMSVTVTVADSGLVRSVQIGGPAAHEPSMTRCARTVLLNTSFGRGPAETLSFAVGLTPYRR